ncbi:HAMP domain-containing protein [Streptomyces clavuligerus]|uniref:histidine kinase n=11 Tax=Streptomyces clavuligerus TaxID=1901 RepID=B5GU89_STRCL|nr:ATP-binding protein [Streptomyces clavuligerus]ANW19159.1 two-component sensor histidine kinase [Streptomyces clavuligerus]AXU13743.1 HAMP domain-containing protein [Streptomyces clavuligerus]EDY49885.1 sensory protein kinase [Streptomyces clavuligerus]EFG08090.1 Sensor protein [Streptomyces clavuligerus]MBY6303719.1 HAMP domain-containing protein [Streptomyces clavuligerus]
MSGGGRRGGGPSRGGPSHVGPGRLGPGSAIRLRIALVYGVAFLVLGGVLLALVNLFARAGTASEAAEIARRAEGSPGPVPVPIAGADPVGGGELARLTGTVSDAAAGQLLFWSFTGLLATALCAVVVGWWTAGRVLRPVHEMTARARRLSERNLGERIAASGPDDELKELGDTLDALLARLEGVMDSQRRFIANASHELRTPLATQRAAIQVGLDPEHPEDVAATREILLEANLRSERLIDGLLTLARGERGLGGSADDREDVDLGGVAVEEAGRYGVGGAAVRVVRAGPVRGNRALLGRLVGNLVANAVAYNVPDGTVSVRVEGGVLTVENTGPVVERDQVPALFEPFRRGEGRDRMGPGAGLGLSIVRSIAHAHDGEVTARPGPRGGLTVTVSLPLSGPAGGGGPGDGVRGARP